VKNEVDAKMFREYVSRLIGKANIPQTSHPIGDYVSGTTQKAPVTKSSHSIGNYVSGLIARTVETQSSHSIERQTLEAGTCIRSGHKVSFNTDKPFCADCYRQWAKYKKEDYEEKYCHSCGKSAKTTFAKPLCMACWKKSN
jgi:hypothetical protein